MRRAAKVDANQADIVLRLRQIGATVQSLAAVGNGCPDLLVGYRGRNLALEVKDGAKVPSARQLTPAEAAWHKAWRGQVHVVKTFQEALAVVCGQTMTE